MATGRVRNAVIMSKSVDCHPNSVKNSRLYIACLTLHRTLQSSQINELKEIESATVGNLFLSHSFMHSSSNTLIHTNINNYEDSS